MLDGSGNYIEKKFTLTDPLPFSPEKEIRIPDPNLAAAIRDQIGGTITTHTIEYLTEINANSKGIKDLTGLEHAQDLMTLSLSLNDISDITSLSKCTRLHWLLIDYNRISDFTPLSKLVHLNVLELSGTGITDVSILKDLIYLNYLALKINGISDVSPLAAHKRLKNLFLDFNDIADISPLSVLTQLTGLYITNNAISYLSPLSKLTQLRILELDNNKINDVSPLAELVNLKRLHLTGNPIQDTKPLFDLLRRNPSMEIYLNDLTSVLKLPTTDPTPPPIDQSPQKVILSEFMFESAGGKDSLPQWIEVYNSSSSAVNLRGWKLHWKRLQPSLLETTTTFKKDFIIPPQQPRLIVTTLGRRSGGSNLSDASVYQLDVLHAEELAQDDIANHNRLITRGGFSLKLLNSEDVLIDQIGTLSNDKQTWELPVCLIDGVHSSLIRRFDEGVPRSGIERSGWMRAYDAIHLIRGTYYGSQYDLSTPGYRRGKPLPVELSQFSAKFVKDEVVINWITETELDNAGFNIYRSTSPTKNFQRINTKLIQGAGTTGERNTYQFIDKTAKPDVAYYYRIEDVDFSGTRGIFTTYRLRGVITPTGKITTTWGTLKDNR